MCCPFDAGNAITIKACPICDRRYFDGSQFCVIDDVLLVPRPQEQLLGTIIGDHFQIEEVIGSGAWGTVYRAVNLELRYPVAIKLLHPHLVANSKRVDQFRREAEAAMSVVHPNAVKIYDFGISGKQPYIVMEFVDGETLAERLRSSGAFDTELALAILAQVGDALHYAHRLGIVHRDVKPANIMLSNASGGVKAKVLDFGLASVESDSNSSSESADSGYTGLRRIGTPAYMSPEHFNGSPVDQRSDIYSLGCVAYEMLTGNRPFSATSPMGYALQHQNAEAPPLPARIPAHVKESISVALMKEPSSRFRSMRDLQQSLAGFSSMPPSELSKKPRRAQQLNLLIAVRLVLILTLTFLSIVVFAPQLRNSTLANIPKTTRQPDGTSPRLSKITPNPLLSFYQQRAREIAFHEVKPTSPESRYIATELARQQMAGGDYIGAAATLQQITQDFHKMDDDVDMLLWTTQAELLHAQEKYLDESKVLTKMLVVVEQTTGENSLGTETVLSRLADAQHKANHLQDGVNTLRTLHQVRCNRYGATSKSAAATEQQINLFTAQLQRIAR